MEQICRNDSVIRVAWLLPCSIAQPGMLSLQQLLYFPREKNCGIGSLCQFINLACVVGGWGAGADFISSV